MLAHLLSFITYLFIFLFPLFSLPITADSYEYNKMALLVGYDILLFSLLTLKWIRDGKIICKRSLFDIPLFLIAMITLIATLFQSPNLTVALTTPLGTSTIIAGFFLYFFLTQIIKEGDKEIFLLILTIDALLISGYTLLLYLGILPKSLFTPAGSLPPTAIFLGIMGIYLLTKMSRVIASVAKQSLDKLIPLFYLSSSFLFIASSTILIVFHLFTDQKPSILPLPFGWAIVLEVLKNIRTLTLGIGPSNFMTAFTLGKPALINTSPVWNVIFTASSSFFFTLISETGILSGILYIVILIKSVKLLNQPTHLQPTTHHLQFILPLISLLITLILLPANMTVFILLIVLLALNSCPHTTKTIHLARSRFLNYLLFIPIGLGIGLLTYLTGRAYSAEVVFKQSLDSLVNNQGNTAYLLQKSAIALNPYLDRYHLAFSRTNLALVHALSGKKNLSEEEKQTLPKLAQIAITEARNAVLLYRTNVVNWDNLGRTYAGLTNFAAGSEQWAIQSFEQKLILDPLNPQARLALGAFYLTLRQPDNAENLIRQAIALKHDYANAHYYLAQILNNQKKYKEAYQELQITVALLPPESEDSKKVVSEMNEIAKLLPSSEIRKEIPQGKKETPQQLEDVLE